MKVELLQESFTKAPGNLPSRFVQVKRNEYAAMYRREDPDDGKVISFEVFAIKVLQAGEIFGKAHGAYERYPSASDFGHSAWECRDECRAEEVFKELTKGKGSRKEELPIKVKVLKTPGTTGKRGRAKTIRPEVKFPKNSFTMKDLAALNLIGWTQPTLYVEVQGLLGSKLEVAARKSLGRGKPTVFYRVK